MDAKEVIKTVCNTLLVQGKSPRLKKAGGELCVSDSDIHCENSLKKEIGVGDGRQHFCA